MLDDAPKAVRDVQNVLGYFSWGSNDPMNRVRHFGMSFVPGAITGTFVSSDARTFKEPPADWQPLSNWNDQKTWFGGSPQSLTGDLIHDGATGASGYVAEPYLESTERPQILFPAYASGFNLAESYYLALPHLSWQSVILGDPLCRPFPRKTLGRADIEAPLDEKTELPGYFSKARLAAAKLRLAIDNPDTLARVVKAEARIDRGDRAGAKKAYEEAVAADPMLATAQFQLGMLEDAEGNHEAAIERYKKVIAIEPRNAIALNNLAYGLAVYKNDPAAARPLRGQGGGAGAAGWGGARYARVDRAPAGRQCVGSQGDPDAVNGAPNNAEVRMHAAFIYAAAGATAAALSEYDFAIKLDPALAERADVKELKRKPARGEALTLRLEQHDEAGFSPLDVGACVAHRHSVRGFDRIAGARAHGTGGTAHARRRRTAVTVSRGRERQPPRVQSGSGARHAATALRAPRSRTHSRPGWASGLGSGGTSDRPRRDGRSTQLHPTRDPNRAAK